MITAKFLIKESFYSGFIVSGHAGGKYGHDIVCAGVSSAVMLTANLITEHFVNGSYSVKVKIFENAVGVWYKGEENRDDVSKIIEALKTHLKLLDKNGKKIRIVTKHLSGVNKLSTERF